MFWCWPPPQQYNGGAICSFSTRGSRSPLSHTRYLVWPCSAYSVSQIRQSKDAVILFCINIYPNEDKHSHSNNILTLYSTLLTFYVLHSQTPSYIHNLRQVHLCCDDRQLQCQMNATKYWRLTNFIYHTSPEWVRFSLLNHKDFTAVLVSEMDVVELGETPPVEQKHFRTLTVKAS